MHKSIWFQLHWFFGAIFGVLLLLIGVSGAVLSYEKEILNLINKDTYYVQNLDNKARLEQSEVLKIYQENNIDTKINSISFSSLENSSIVLNIEKEGARKGLNIYLNPYTAEVLPQIVGKDFFMFFFSLHRWLTFSGDTQWIGKQLVAISTIVAIFLTIGGVVVYWPRIKANFLKSFTFSFKYKKRAFVSILHSSLGMWVVPFFIIMCITGLYWSYDWYRGAMFTVMGVEQPKRVAQKVEANNKPQTIVYDNISKSIEIFEQNVAKEYKNANLRLTPSKDGIYTISYLYAKATHFREINSMEIDPNSSLVVKDTKFEDKKLNEQLMASMLPLHSGEYFGWFGQLSYFISSFLMALFAITGYMLYYDRWKKKKAKALKEKVKS